jgi:sigma-54 dependent transcriptional regulator, acetoin dehydrogenase operon transcriptional activator AcoR
LFNFESRNFLGITRSQAPTVLEILNLQHNRLQTFNLLNRFSTRLPSNPVSHAAPAPASRNRLDSIARARQQLSSTGQAATDLVPPWVARSWQRCLQTGHTPDRLAEFDLISPGTLRHTADANAHLVHTAKPLLESLGRAIANTGYFVILTNQHGVVVDVGGPIDRSDRRADLITRIGTDLSEQRVGTTAIGTALSELQPVWLHRGEHFFANTAVYSCAGAPVFGPQGTCVGMLDLTGIDTEERPELGHLVTQVAGKIGNALVLAQPHTLLLHLNWPDNTLGNDADSMVCLDGDGWITAANAVARQMVTGLQANGRVHATEVFGLPLHMLFDAARHGRVLDIPLWTGLHLHAVALHAEQEGLHSRYEPGRTPDHSMGLKDMEASMIRQAVEQAKGNVAQAAQSLGISRATVYRKLGRKLR